MGGSNGNPTDIIRLPGTSMWAMRFVVETWLSAGSPRVNSAGRLYADQKYFWDGWAARRPGFNPADNPDDPNARLPHLRGFALDIDPTGDRVARLTAAGFTRPISYEPWHWEPYGKNVRNYPKVYALPASIDATPFTVSSTPLEEDDMLALSIKDPATGAAHLAALGRGILRHFIGGDNPERIKNIIRADDSWTETTIAELPVLLKTYGVPASAWKLDAGAFKVLDTASGAYRAGGAWVAEEAQTASILAAVSAVVPPNAEPPAEQPGTVGPWTIDISRHNNAGNGFSVDTFKQFKAAGVGRVIVKLGGSNSAHSNTSLNDVRNLYSETVHQDNARAAGLLVDNYWANGTQGTPEQVARFIVDTGQVKSGDVVWDVEQWDNPSGRIWTPSQVEAYATALRDAGVPFNRQVIYLNLNDANNGGYAPVAKRLGLRLWLAHYTTAQYTLVKGGWDQKPIYWQFTSGNTPELRKVYDNPVLDVNRSGVNAWIVSELQTALNKLGAGLTVDNDYGRATATAVAAFQKSAGLVVDGDAGSRTITALAARLEGSAG